MAMKQTVRSCGWVMLEYLVYDKHVPCVDTDI
jgi:hypothetical protein